MTRFHSHNSTGFTLIELLVVIAIISILSTIATVSLQTANRRSRDSKRVADIQMIRVALSLHFNDQNAYPNVAAPGVTLGDANNTVLCTPSGATDGLEPDTTTCVPGKVQLLDIPSNPTPNGSDYTYTGTDTDYTLQFTLEDKVGDIAAGLNCGRPTGVSQGACPVL